jgi:pimeloyl-ACP methyl ester carboxylesterase/tetratricopeptide (TPR) repeat protein
LVAVAAALIAVTAAPARAQNAGAPLAPELQGLGTLHSPVTTKNERAQRFFNQGLRLLYAFNHAEALRAFQEAARLDSGLSLAYWGQAMALGPNLNAPMTAENGRRAFQAISRGVAAAGFASDRERALVEALAARFSEDGAGDRQALDRAYAEAMGRVAATYPEDPDVQTLFADAVMNTMPWDYWQKDGSAKPATRQVIAALEAVIASRPDHPGAHHYFIHVMEASNDPDRAIKSADALGALMPAAGHMVHMPAHIYLRVGRYADAAEANERAIVADEDYLAQCQAQGLYPITYYPHNLHFLWAAATLEGRSAKAVDAARKLEEKVPHHHAGALGWTADFPVTPLLAYARFGRWQEILTTPAPPANEPYATGIWRYARGLALLARGQLDRSDAERAALDAAMSHEAFKTTLKDLPLLTNLQIASRILEGELAARRGRVDEAVRLIEEAVQIEDGLPYNEPPVWHQPPRQVLGAVLLEAGRAREAEAVYRRDLERVRENGWSLMGLASSLDAQGRGGDAADARRRFAKAWARADISITSSRILAAAVPSNPTIVNDHANHAGAARRERAEDMKFIDLPTGARLAYVEQGAEAGAPVVLLHGVTDSLRSFDLTRPFLPASMRVFALSQRGHGDSGRPASGYAPDDFAADVRAFLDAMRIERAVIVGHSMGGGVAQRFASDYPDRTLGLVLVSTLGRWRDSKGAEEFARSVVATLADPIPPAIAREFQESTIGTPIPPEFLDLVVNESLKVPARVWRAVFDGFMDFDGSKGLSKVAVPTLVVWGDRDVLAVRAAQDAFVAAIPGAKLNVYVGVGHALHWEEPERFAADLAAFVNTLRSPVMTAARERAAAR